MKEKSTYEQVINCIEYWTKPKELEFKVELYHNLKTILENL